MKSWKVFIWVVNLFLSVPVTGWACGYWDNHANYNIFRCVEPLPDAKAAQFNETLQFWAKYTGLEVDQVSPDIRWLDMETFDQLNEKNQLIVNPNENQLLKTLSERKDVRAIEFLRLNTRLEEYRNNSNNWKYEEVTEQDFQKLLQQIESLEVPETLSQRKTFLRMRCLYHMKRYDDCLNLWEGEVSQWADSPLRMRVEGYVAGIYFARGEFAKASDIYFRLGDDESIIMCVNRLLNASDAEGEYQRDPNSRLLGYLLEDYANYYYHAIAHDIAHLPAEEHPIWSTVWGESSKMEQFALRVVKEGKAQDLQMWQTFAGFIQLVRGESRKAYNSFCTAETLEGNSISPTLISYYKLMAQLDYQQPNAELDEYLGEALVSFSQGHFSSADEARNIRELFDYELSTRIEKYLKRKKAPHLPLFFAQSIYAGWWDNGTLEMSDHLTVAQVRQILDVVRTESCSDALVAKLLPVVKFSERSILEVLGTKLLREGQFAEAAACLKKVPMSYLKTLGIAPYLASRVPSQVPFTRQDYQYPSESALSRNVKLEYCRQVLDLQRQIATCSDVAQRHSLQYRLADLYFQASPAGDLWAISEYGQSETTDSLCNGLNLLADSLIHKILAETTDKSMQIFCYYALAANPVNGVVPSLVYEYSPKTIQLSASKGQSYQAYQWLQQNRTPTHPVFASCDWLKLYVIERPDDSPSYSSVVYNWLFESPSQNVAEEVASCAIGLYSLTSKVSVLCLPCPLLNVATFATLFCGK